MDRENVLQAAREAGFSTASGWNWVQQLECLYAIAYEAGRKDEREAAAQICDVPQGTEGWEIISGEEGIELCRSLAAAIRARSNNGS